MTGTPLPVCLESARLIQTGKQTQLLASARLACRGPSCPGRGGGKVHSVNFSAGRMAETNTT